MIKTRFVFMMILSMVVEFVFGIAHCNARIYLPKMRANKKS